MGLLKRKNNAERWKKSGNKKGEKEGKAEERIRNGELRNEKCGCVGERDLKQRDEDGDGDKKRMGDKKWMGD